MKKKIPLFYIPLIILSLALAYGGFHLALWRLSDGFSIKNIQSDLLHSQAWQIPPISKQDSLKVDEVLSGPFHYLGKGSQCYVFESEDKKFVIKFFRHQRYRIPEFANSLPLPPFLSEIQKKRIFEKSEKRDRLFQSCKLAYEKLHEESGLLCLHLNKTDHLNKRVVLYDKLNRNYIIDIDKYEFLIQKKATLIYPYLSTLIRDGETEKAYEALVGIKNLLMIRFEKGVADSDPVITKNAGFLDGKPIYLDVGQFFENKNVKNPNIYQTEIMQVTRKLSHWLYEHSPELGRRFDETLLCIKTN